MALLSKNYSWEDVLYSQAVFPSAVPGLCQPLQQPAESTWA